MRAMILMLLLLGSTAVANDHPVYELESITCQIGNLCKTQIGSAGLLKIDGGYAWFLSAGHVLAKKPRIQIGDNKYPITKIQEWPTRSLMPDSVILLRTTIPVPDNGHKTYYLDPEGRTPQAGDRVWLIGYPKGKFKYLDSVITTIRADQFATKHHLTSGSSGGVVVYQDSSTLAGIIHGYSLATGEGIATRSDLIVTHLQDQFAHLLPSTGTPEPVEEPPVEVVAPDPQPPVEEAPVDVEKWEAKQAEELKEALEAARKVQDDALKQYREEDAQHRGRLIEEILGAVQSQVAPILQRQQNELDDLKRRKEGDAPLWDGGAEDDRKSKLPIGAALPWATILSGLGLAVPGGALGWLAISAGSKLFRRKGVPQAVPSAPLFQRDVSEAEQLIGLRQSEQREPIFDNLLGILFEDEFSANPDQSLKEAHAAIYRRFNKIAPVSVKTTEE